jgi:hypothetical protein
MNPDRQELASSGKEPGKHATELLKDVLSTKLKTREEIDVVARLFI